MQGYRNVDAVVCNLDTSRRKRRERDTRHKEKEATAVRMRTRDAEFRERLNGFAGP